MPTKLAAFLLSLITLTLGVAATARAGFINGSFENSTSDSTVGPSQLDNTGKNGYTTLAGWNVGSGTYGFLMAPGAADTTGSYSPQYGNTFRLWGSNDGGAAVLPTSSPDGGNYVVLDAGAGYRGTGISQTITGLTAGKQYLVSFDWASGQQKGYDGTTDELLQVSFAGQTKSTADVTNVSHGFTPWQRLSFSFIADGASDTLNFLASSVNYPSGMPPMVLLDGVTFGAVPEPSSVALLGIGIVGVAAVRRSRRGTAEPA